MDQNRLYYGTPYVKSFMCTVLSCTPSKKGTWEAVFDQTGDVYKRQLLEPGHGQQG